MRYITSFLHSPTMFGQIQRMRREEPEVEIPKEYNLAGQPWETAEDKQLIKEYNTDNLTLLEICRIHKRMPGGIMSRLKRLGLVQMKDSARGYDEYLKSDLYKLVSKITKERKQEVKQKPPLTQTRIEDSMVFQQKDGVYETLKELLVVAKDIQRMMKDFHADNFVTKTN